MYTVVNLFHLHVSAHAPMKKDLVAASSEPLVLSLLSHGESYGYEIIQKLKALSDGEVNWTDGMLYPVLHRLERKGMLKSRWVRKDNRRRKYYRISAAGRRSLSKEKQDWLLVQRMLQDLWQGQSKGGLGHA